MKRRIYQSSQVFLAFANSMAYIMSPLYIPDIPIIDSDSIGLQGPLAECSIVVPTVVSGIASKAIVGKHMMIWLSVELSNQC